MAHGGNLRCIAVSQDRTKLVSVVPTRQRRSGPSPMGPVATLSGRRRRITATVFSSDGSRIAVGAADGVRIWGGGRAIEQLVTPVATTGTGLVETSVTAGHRAEDRATRCVGDTGCSAADTGTTRVRLAPDGKTVFASGAAKVVRGWSISRWCCITNPAQPAQSDRSIHRSLNRSRWSASGGRVRRQGAYLWDLTAGNTAATKTRSRGSGAEVFRCLPAVNIAISGDGKLVVVPARTTRCGRPQQ